MCESLEREIARRLASGCELVPFSEMQSRIAALGYRLDRRMDCRSTSRDMKTGESYPCVTGYPVERDTGRSFAHFRDARRDARRDAAFRDLQDLRFRVFAVVRGAVYDA